MAAESKVNLDEIVLLHQGFVSRYLLQVVAKSHPKLIEALDFTVETGRWGGEVLVPHPVDGAIDLVRRHFAATPSSYRMLRLVAAFGTFFPGYCPEYQAVFQLALAQLDQLCDLKKDHGDLILCRYIVADMLKNDMVPETIIQDLYPAGVPKFLEVYEAKELQAAVELKAP